MSWRIRHEGSPRSIEGLTLPEVNRGLLDGLWEPSDEVMGPEDLEWVAIENHPKFAELALDIEPPAPKVHEDETRLDMTALIDVTMVLLIFFILITSYAALQKIIEGPTTSSQELDQKRPVVTTEQVKAFMIMVRIVQEDDGQWGFRVEGDPVKRENLTGRISQFVKDTRKTDMLIDCPDKAPRDAMIAVLDAAKKTGIKPHDLRPKKEAKPPENP